MWCWTVLFLMAFSPLLAVDLNDLRRTEDWEMYLSRAVQMTREQKFGQAQELYQSLVAAADQFEFPLILKAKCLNNLGSMLHLSGRYAEAERKYLEASRMWAGSAGPDSDENATTMNNLGEVYRQMGRYADAEAAYRKALAVREAIAREQQLRLAAALNNLATSQVQSLGVAGTLANIGDVQRAQHRMADAEATFQRALAIKREILGPNHPEVATSLNNLGTLRQDLGDSTGAEKLYLEAAAIREAQQPVDRPALASVLNNIGTLHRKTNRLDSAEKYMLRANTLWEESLGPNHPTFAAGLNNLAELLLAEDRASEAEPMFRRSIAIQEASLGPDHPQTATAIDNLGAMFMRQQKAAGAETLFRRALAARTVKLGDTNKETLESMHHLAQSLQVQGRYTEAGRVLTGELALLELAKMQRTPRHGQALADLAYIELMQRHYDAGEKYLNEVGQFVAELPPGQREQVGELYQAYARILRGNKRNRDAERIEGKARSFLPQ